MGGTSNDQMEKGHKMIGVVNIPQTNKTDRSYRENKKD